MVNQQTQKFKEAVFATLEVRNCYQKGLQAMGSYSRKVELSDERKANGSVGIDSCVYRIYPNENRWDYVFGYDGEAFFVEVHSAETSEVSVVLRKLQWLKDWLNSQAPELKRIKAKNRTPFFWIQSGRFNVLQTSPQYKRLVNVGLLPISHLKL